MAFDSKKIRMIAADVYVGASVKQVQKIVTQPDNTGSLGGKYFLFIDQSGGKHYVWLDTGTSVDPVPAGGWVGLKVTITSGMDAPSIASAIATKLATLATAVSSATASGSEVTFTLKSAGYAQPVRDSDALTTQTGFAFSVDTLGSVEAVVGSLSGDIEVSGFGATEIEIKEHQSGSTPIAKIVTGMKNPEVSFKMQETDKATLQKVFTWTGNYSMTPEGANGTEGFGFGMAGVGASKPRQQVRIHPIAKGSDLSQDIVFWACTADLDKLALSSEKVVEVPVKMTAYPDDSKPPMHNIMYIGDYRNFP
jgi:hypothetical protein